MKSRHLYILAAFITLPAAHADTMGRLFYTPQQRAQMDYTYARNAAPDGKSPVLTVNGIVQKSDGSRTVWINGVAQTTRGPKNRNPVAETVNVPGKSGTVRLKVGDKILIDQPAAAPAATE